MSNSDDIVADSNTTVNTDNEAQEHDPFRGAHRVTVDKYNELYAAYREKQSIDFVARTCGVHWQTARRYIEDGDPRRHLRPIKVRFAEVMIKAQQREDFTLAKANSEMRKAARAMFAKYVQRIQKLKPDEIDPNKMASALRELQAVLLKSFGEADLVVESKGRFTGWTLEELTVYAETGAAPEHDNLLTD